MFEDTKKECLKTVEKLKILLTEYSKDEPAVEYYRYIFENETVNKNKELILKNPIVSLDFNLTNNLFLKIISLFDTLCIKLREIIYIYFTL